MPTVKLVVEALVMTVLPRIVVTPVEEPIVERPAKVARFGKEVVAARRVSKRSFLQKRLVEPSVKASEVVPKRNNVEEAAMYRVSDNNGEVVAMI